MENIELKRFWEQVKEELLGVLPENAHPWLYPLEVSGYDKGVLTVVTGQMMGRDLLRKNHYNQMVEALKRVSGDENSRLVIIYDETAAKTLKRETEKLQKKASEVSIKEQAMENLANMQSAANLNLKYKFENFVQGENSKFAYKAAMAVAQNPAGKYNPLFVYGNSGLGKTHLMQAIGNRIIKTQPEMKVIYVSSEQFTNEFIDALKDKRTLEFKRKYRGVDVLLIDDVQFLERTESIQEEFFHTFNDLYSMNKQIVLTSDRKPGELVVLEERLRTRFSQGLIIDITVPNYETRVAILKKKAEVQHVVIDEEVLAYLANRIKSNIRELEGALLKIISISEISHREINIELAEYVLKSILPEDGIVKITPDKIMDKVSVFYNITKDDLTGKIKTKNVAFPRQIAMYLCNKLTDMNFGMIGKAIGNKDRTTVMHNVKKIESEITTNEALKADINYIIKDLESI